MSEILIFRFLFVVKFLFVFNRDRLAIHHSQSAVELAIKLNLMNSKMRRSVKRSSCLQSSDTQ